MSVISKKVGKDRVEVDHPLDKKFPTAQAAAEAKTDYLLNQVLKGYDLSKLRDKLPK